MSEPAQDFFNLLGFGLAPEVFKAIPVGSSATAAGLSIVVLTGKTFTVSTAGCFTFLFLACTFTVSLISSISIRFLDGVRVRCMPVRSSILSNNAVVGCGSDSDSDTESDSEVIDAFLFFTTFCTEGLAEVSTPETPSDSGSKVPACNEMLGKDAWDVTAIVSAAFSFPFLVVCLAVVILQ
jgi:hypothetical protein